MTPDLYGLIETGKTSFEAVARKGEEMLPILLVEASDGAIVVMGLAGGHPFDVLVAALPVLQDMQPRKLSLTTDSYSIIAPKEGTEDVEAIRRRYNYSLQAAFEAGEPMVTEALAFQIVTPTTVTMAMLPYVRNDEKVDWGEAMPIEGAAEGRMIDVLRMVWT
jgi:hypothetical protein